MRIMMRTALFACAALAAAAAPAFAQQAPARCAETSFRVYFAQDSASLDAETRQILDIASRNTEGCDYSEIRVALDASDRLSMQRGRAIAAALDEQSFDATHFTPRSMTQSASFGPDYAEVTLSPTPSHPQELRDDADTGV
jgi:outer membrane protein OmpA-like peptidoglycan-associated protein